MVFLFTLKGFPHKFGALYFSVLIFLVLLLFTNTITIHVYSYCSSMEEILPESSNRAIEVDHSSQQVCYLDNCFV